MEVKIKPPPDVTAPFVLDYYYLLEATSVTFDISQRLHEHKIKDKNKYLVEGYEHSSTAIKVTGVLTADSDFQGADLEEKKDNLIKAASEWWLLCKTKATSAFFYWRGWEQRVMIERVEFMKNAGEVESYDYDLSLLVHEGA